MATILYDEEWVESTILRLADEIAADPMPGQRYALVGVRTRGAVVAERLIPLLAERNKEFSLGFLDTTMYRDDLSQGTGLREMQGTEIDFDLNDCGLVLIDDVLATGRTIRAGLNALFAYGRPACVRLLSMLDRGGREVPIQPDFVGAHVDVPAGGFVRLRLKENDQADAVYLVKPGEDEPA